MTTTFTRALGAIVCAALVSACSAGGTNTAPGLTPASHGLIPIAHAFKTGRFVAHFHVPAPKRHKAAFAKGGKHPHWLPASVTEIDFTLEAVNGDSDNIGSCNVGQGSNCFNFSIYTGGSQAGGCTSDGNGGLVCNVNEPAPAAADTYQIQAQHCSGLTNADGTCGAPSGLTLISQGESTITVPLNGSINGNFTLNPVVASIQWNASAINVGSGQPFASGALAGSPIVQIQALDQYGDVIVGATSDATNAKSDTYNTALYLQSDGSVDNISWNCNDPSIQFITGGGPFSDLGGFTPESQEVLANGYSPGSYDLKHHRAGVHPSDGSYPSSFNSPETNPSLDYDGGNWGMGVDGNGNPVQGIGNNGTEINYDGSDPLDLSTQYSCTAYDSEGNQASITIQLGNGSITWGANATRGSRR